MKTNLTGATLFTLAGAAYVDDIRHAPEAPPPSALASVTTSTSGYTVHDTIADRPIDVRLLSRERKTELG